MEGGGRHAGRHVVRARHPEAATGARRAGEEIGKSPRIRCLFIEKDAHAFTALEAAAADATDLGARALHGGFEESIPAILDFVGGAFALVFVDPTGWTGFGLRRIAPLLEHEPGEVLINFMFDHINRFLGDPAGCAASFDELFGGPGWNDAVAACERREAAILDLYLQRVRGTGRFRHVTSTRILKPTMDRAYYYLVYGTRHWKGLLEFRKVEEAAVSEQERIRLQAKQDRRVARTGQTEMFAGPALACGPASFEHERKLQRAAALARLRALLDRPDRIAYVDALAESLELPLVWERDVKAMILELQESGDLAIEGLRPRERTPKPGHYLVRPKLARGR